MPYKPTPMLSTLLVGVLLSFSGFSQDCDQLGLVTKGSVVGVSECEWLILKLNDGTLISPVNEWGDLSEGGVILFSYEVVDSLACSENRTMVEITCIRNAQECRANFLSYPKDILNSRQYGFEVIAPDTELQYIWDFGDGTKANTTTAEHTYATNGAFVVCLSVSNGEGCEEQTCDTIIVSSPLLHFCNYEIIASQEDAAHQLEIYNTRDVGPYHPQSVEWYKYETSEILGTAAILSYIPEEKDPLFINICAAISALDTDGNNCTSTLCQVVFNEAQLMEGDSSCQALFSYLPSPAGGIEFFNQSILTTAISVEWNFGDGTIYTNPTETILHSYDTPGLYEVCLSIQDAVGCSDIFCLPVYTNEGSAICEYTDCVFPGDTDKDGVVNIFDVLPIGVGYNASGTVRPNATIEPIFQAAFDWLGSLFESKDAKHADCDGNGYINEADLLAIDKNYQSVAKKSLITNPNLPAVHLSFPSDTLAIENAAGNQVTIPLTITVGSEAMPIEDFYGLALAFDYEATNKQGITSKALSTSFVGSPTNLLVTDKDVLDNQQYGLAITKKDQKGIKGFGPIAEVGFVIIIDISEALYANINLEVNDLKVINTKGEEIPVNLSTESVDLTILSIENRPITTSTEEVLLKESVSISPNPATSHLQISLDASLSLQNGFLEIYNNLGEKVLQQAVRQSMSSIDVSGRKAGVYWLSISLEAGRYSQQVVILE